VSTGRTPAPSLLHRPVRMALTGGSVDDWVPGPPPTWRRAIALLWVGQVVSHFGDSLYLVGIFYLALEVTGSKAVSGLLMSLSFVPALCLGLFAGAFVDRHDRRRVMLAAELLRGLAVAAIPALHALGQLRPLALALAMFLTAAGATLFNPALKAIVPELVPAPQLTRAVAVFQLSEYAAKVVGPALAALVIIPAFGSIHLFTIDAATFLVSGLCLLALAPIARRPAHALPIEDRSGPVRAGRPDLWREVSAGARAVLAIPLLRRLLVLVALDNLLLAGLHQVATPLLVKEQLGLDTDAFARAQSFFFLGLLVASALVWAGGQRLPRGPAMLLGIVLDGLTFLPLAFCDTLAEVQAALLLHALAVPLMIIPRTVLVQQLVPGPGHGRAFALLNVTVFGMTAVSTALTGVLAESLSPQQLYLGLGTLGALAGAAGLLEPALRRAR
jgi:MFS transporter, DHA3 family, macrolide efflux protein